MEYKLNNCGATICSFYENSKIIERIRLMTYYQVYNAAKEAFVFSFSYLCNCCVGKIHRRAKRFIYKALPPNIDHSSDTQGIPQCWTQAPPKRNTFRIFHKIMNEHRDSKWRLKIPKVLGVLGKNQAPPSAKAREHVYQDLRYKNQQTDFAV